MNHPETLKSYHEIKKILKDKTVWVLDPDTNEVTTALLNRLGAQATASFLNYQQLGDTYRDLVNEQAPGKNALDLIIVDIENLTQTHPEETITPEGFVNIFSFYNSFSEKQPLPKIIFTSASPLTDKEKRELEKFGVYLAKPYGLTELEEAVKNAFNHPTNNLNLANSPTFEPHR